MLPRNSPDAISTCRNLVETATQLNFDLDDVRGRYIELSELEDVLQSLLDKLQVSSFFSNSHHVVANFLFLTGQQTWFYSN